MSNLPKIIGYREDKLVLQINGQEIELSLESLQSILEANGQTSFQVADKIYNIDQINTANFSLQVQKLPPIPKELTNYSPPLTFIGREKEIEDIKNILSNEKTVVLVNGLGGIGKTSLAKEYLKRYSADYQYIAWLEQTSTLTNAFILEDILHQNLGLKFSNEDENYKFKTILNALKNLNGHNLLIIDNYSEKAEDKALNSLAALPFANNWKILITSREKIAKFTPLVLDTLSEAEAITLFKTHCPDKPIIEEELKILLQTIAYHTLTIELLAKNY
jgi:hypothetical protein